MLRPRQEQLLKLLAKGGGMTPAAIREALKVSKQGSMDLLRPLLQAGLVKRIGTLKTGRYVLKRVPTLTPKTNLSNDKLRRRS